MFRMFRLVLGMCQRCFRSRKDLLLRNLVLRQQLAMFKQRIPFKFFRGNKGALRIPFLPSFLPSFLFNTLEGQAAPQNSFVSISLADSNPTLSAIFKTPFWHGQRKAVRVGSLPMSLTAETTSAPNFASRSNSKNLCGCV